MTTTIKLFNQAFTGSDCEYNKIAEFGCRIGYLVHPDCSTLDVLHFLQSQQLNYNSTFYKSWKDVTSKNRWQLFVDQVKHYASTYGTDYMGKVYLPNDNPELVPFKDFKIILPITKEEAQSKAESLLTSGVALSNELILDIFDIFRFCNYEVDLDIIRNREAKMIICKTQNILPKDPVEMVRFLVYLATDQTSLIKDRATIKKIKEANVDISSYVYAFGGEKLSSVFYRFKPIFLAFKFRNGSLINRLRRLAKKNHQPAKKGYFENLLNDFSDIGLLPDKLKELNNFKKITLLEAIKVRKTKTDINFYPIRNGKIWVEEIVSKDKPNSALDLIYHIVYESLVNSLKIKATTIKIANGVHLKLPKSEKSFVGNYPVGTSFDLSDSDAIIGINWRASEGADDLDLKLVDLQGSQFGWNTSYYNDNKSVVFSGDMTSANPEATELFYASNGFSPSIIKVNLYNGADKSKFRFFAAKEQIGARMRKNYMVDPNNLLFSIDMEMDSKEMSLGVITENQLLVTKFRTGNKKVGSNSITDNFIKYALDIKDTYVDLEKLVKEAGFTVVEEFQEAEIDLTNLSKDSLISLLS